MVYTHMKQFLSIITLAALLACSSNTKNQAATEQQDSAAVMQVNEGAIIEEEAAVEDQDCVFNNDKLGLTTEWAKESGFANFIWDSDEELLKILVNSDTIVLSKGGCYHFVYYVEIRLYSDTTSVGNLEHWKEVAIELAERFNMKQFYETLNSGDFVLLNEAENAFWIEVTDENPSDNLIYNGVEVDLSGEFKFVALSKYVN